MAHFAQIDQNNVVINVLVVPDEQEHRGQEYLAEDLGLGGRWIQTSYHGNIRNIFAGIGYLYNEDLDIFTTYKPFPSWILNTEKGIWEAPIPPPTVDGDTVLNWDENNQVWVESIKPTVDDFKTT
jgi:hypothetical protein